MHQVAQHLGPAIASFGEAAPSADGVAVLRRQNLPGSALADCPTDALRAAVALVPDPVLFVESVSLRLSGFNRAACTALGYSHCEMASLTLADILATGEIEPLAGALAELHAGSLLHKQHIVKCRRRSGAVLRTTIFLDCALLDSPHAPLVLLLRPVEASDCEAPSPWLCDPLTGLPRRDVLDESLARAARRAERNAQRFAVLFLDVDRFKQINDVRGHLAGDEVLRTIARRLAGCLRQADLAVRFGGDEFVLLAGDLAGRRDVSHLARRIRRAMRAPIGLAGRPAVVTVSIGAALSDGRSSGAALLERADRAMYQAKGQGRCGRFVLDRERT